MEIKKFFKKTIDYSKWNFWITIALTLIIIIISLITLYYTIPKVQLSIFYDTQSGKNFFTVTNIGDNPATNVKISYSLDCQNVSYDLKFINADIPILTESNGANPSYKHFFDNKTFEIYDYYLRNRNLCNKFEKRILYVPYSGKINSDCADCMDNFLRMNVSKINVTRLICEPCKLTINVESNEDKERFQYSFLNPIEFNHTLFCIDSPNKFRCDMDLVVSGPSSLKFREHADFFQPSSYEKDGINLKYNSWREPIKIREENRIII